MNQQLNFPQKLVVASHKARAIVRSSCGCHAKVLPFLEMIAPQGLSNIQQPHGCMGTVASSLYRSHPEALHPAIHGTDVTSISASPHWQYHAVQALLPLYSAMYATIGSYSVHTGTGSRVFTVDRADFILAFLVHALPRALPHPML